MNRRTFMRGAVIAASTPATIGALSLAIPDMYREWLTVKNRDVLNMSDEENDVQSERYIALQARILAAEPETPSDVALQFLVDTDGGDSYVSDVFVNRIRQLAAA